MFSICSNFVSKSTREIRLRTESPGDQIGRVKKRLTARHLSTGQEDVGQRYRLVDEPFAAHGAFQAIAVAHLGQAILTPAYLSRDYSG
jgi:hypothetical protein